MIFNLKQPAAFRRLGPTPPKPLGQSLALFCFTPFRIQSRMSLHGAQKFRQVPFLSLDHELAHVHDQDGRRLGILETVFVHEEFLGKQEELTPPVSALAESADRAVRQAPVVGAHTLIDFVDHPDRPPRMLLKGQQVHDRGDRSLATRKCLATPTRVEQSKRRSVKRQMYGDAGLSEIRGHD
jgi:hypothetical protein